MKHKAFGRTPDGERLDRIRKSPNYRNGAFRNLSRTRVMAEDGSFWKAMRAFFKKTEGREPTSLIPSIHTSLRTLDPDQPTIVWFGHSSYFIRINGKNILIDPVFGKSASPLPFMIRAYPGSFPYTTDDMPEIDHLILTHDHYDHLHYETIFKLRSQIKNSFTALGVGSHLEYWGLKAPICEFDWWEERRLDDAMTLIAAPARHFSGRGVRRGKTLWTSFILKTAGHTIYIGGDSGYDRHFAAIGEKFGPFDIAVLEAGQYNAQWPHIHMMPEETVRAALDLKAKLLLPVHWGKFTLALHPWKEPIERVLNKAHELGVAVTTPMIGEPVIIGRPFPARRWWENL